MKVTHSLPVVLLLCCTLQADPVVVSGGPENDYESWLARLRDHRLMLIFCRNPDWESGDLYVTFSHDSGRTWDSAVAIIEDTLNQSTVSFVQMPDDTLRLWYASNEIDDYQIYTAFSTDGTVWYKQGPVDLGWQPWDRHYDPSVILEDDGSLTMSYRGPDGGYIAHCPAGGTWDTMKTCVAPLAYRPRIMKHSNGTYLYAYHRRTGGPYDYDVFVRTSTDRLNWSDSVRLTFNLNSHDPFPNETSDSAYLVYYAKAEYSVYNLYRRRSFDAINWEPEEQITVASNNNTQPHFFCESNDIYLAWAYAVNYPYDHDVYFERSLYPGVVEKITYEIQNRQGALDVYPNPCADVLTVCSNMGETMPTHTIYDVQGRVLYRSATQISTSRYDVTWLPNGAYFLEVSSGDERLVRRFVVIH